MRQHVQQAGVFANRRRQFEIDGGVLQSQFLDDFRQILARMAADAAKSSSALAPSSVVRKELPP